MNSPIIYYHEGYSSFVPIVLRHNKLYSHNNSQYIISDYKYGHVNHIPLGSYDKGVNLNSFKEHYRTLCDNNAHYDYICYKRWFVIYEYMIIHDLESIWHLDSDVLLFNDLNEIENDLKGYDSALILHGDEERYSSIIDYYKLYVRNNESLPQIKIISGHTSYFTLKGLEGLLKLGISMFRDSFDTCNKYYNKAFVDTGTKGGIDDMHMITNYYLNNINTVYDLSKSRYHFDLQVNMITDYKGEYQSDTIHNIKLKRLYDNKLYLNGKPISVITLHFQHLSKYCMHKYIDYRLQPVSYIRQISILYLRRTKTLASKIKQLIIKYIKIEY